MKKLFVLLVIALSAIGASGQTTYVLNKTTCTSVSDKKKLLSVFEYTSESKNFTITLPEGTEKACTYGSNNGLNNGTKFSRNIDYTITVPNDVEISKIKFKGYSNDTKKGNKSYLKINDVEYSDDLFEVAVGSTETVIKDYSYDWKKGEKTLKFRFLGGETVAEIYLTEASESSSITATVGTAGYATFCTTATCKVPSGLTAYTAAYNATSGKVNLTEVADGIIPANNGVILKGEAKEYTMETATSKATTLAGNELVGVTADYTLTGKDYILVNDGGVVKFGKATVGTTLAAGKVYLPIENPNAAKIINMDFDGTTGINAVETASDKDDAYYTLSGVKTLKPTKGMLYIHNGKKYIAK